MRPKAATADDGWLPDFCQLPTLFSTLVAAQLVVMVIGLAPNDSSQWSGGQWVAASALAQWLALCSVVPLCKLRHRLQRLPRATGGALAWAIPVSVAFAGSLLLHALDQSLQLGIETTAASGLQFAGAIAAIAALLAAALLRYFHFQQQWRQQIAAQARSQVEALQARIRPHFLFNSMNSIASLVRRDPDTAERAIEDLADLFRAALGSGDGSSTLDEELRLCERYLAIEALRLGERLQVDWQIAEDVPRQLPLPRLLLQPLVENAVIHGVSQLAAGGRIDILVQRHRVGLRIRIGNPCPRQPPAKSAGNRHAQSSVAQRLAYAFGPRAQMSVVTDEGYYSCELLLPLDAR
jgi:two-component system sensor histidine kinase AlgZ